MHSRIFNNVISKFVFLSDRYYSIVNLLIMMDHPISSSYSQNIACGSTTTEQKNNDREEDTNGTCLPAVNECILTTSPNKHRRISSRYTQLRKQLRACNNFKENYFVLEVNKPSAAAIKKQRKTSNNPKKTNSSKKRRQQQVQDTLMKREEDFSPENNLQVNMSNANTSLTVSSNTTSFQPSQNCNNCTVITTPSNTSNSSLERVQLLQTILSIMLQNMKSGGNNSSTMNMRSSYTTSTSSPSSNINLMMMNNLSFGTLLSEQQELQQPSSLSSSSSLYIPLEDLNLLTSENRSTSHFMDMSLMNFTLFQDWNQEIIHSVLGSHTNSSMMMSSVTNSNACIPPTASSTTQDDVASSSLPNSTTLDELLDLL